ncbi:MAG TPA: transporter, partial [Flavobacteriaceae bacterium]|nr:transporter [Flavobacteriaceae bacterium]
KELLFNPTVGKIATVVIGVVIIWLVIKMIQKNLITKIKEDNNRYRAKKLGSFIGFF